MKKIFVLLFVIFCVNCVAQKNSVSLRFLPMFGTEKLQLEKNYFLSSIKDSVSIDEFRFYVSNVRLIKNGKIVFREKKSFHLIDIGNQLSFFIYPSKKVDYDEVVFEIGIDSLTNVSGAHGGDLDPVNGMYWAWQSGYINMKLEGTCSGCATRNSKFQYHVGGYLSPYASLQTVSVSVKKNSFIDIKINLEKLLSAVTSMNICEVMSPGKNGVLIAELFKSVFSLYE